MNKKLISFFLALILTLTCIVPLQVMAEDTANVAVSTEEGKPSQIVTVKISAAKAFNASTAEICVTYPTTLELIEFKNGTVFETTYSKITGDEKGSFKYVADIGITTDKQSVAVSASAVIFTLSFKVPSGATSADSYAISVKDSVSMFAIGTTNAEGTYATAIPCVSTAGKITVADATACQTHTFGEETVVRTASYFSNGYSYKTCSSCGYVESKITDATKTNVFTPVGTVIRYAGSPSGIGAHFKVDVDAIANVEKAGYKVEIGMELSYGGRTETHVFYGDNAPSANVNNMSDGVISAAIENIKTQQKGTIFAYIKIVDQATGVGRMEKTYNTLLGSEQVSVVDVVSVMNLNKYTQKSRDYLSAVANGFVE